MIYMGSKGQISKKILPLILENRKPNQCFVDLFTGGGNLVQNVDGNCIASDININTISHLKKIQNDTSWIPKNNKEFTKDDYMLVKSNKEYFKGQEYFLGHAGYNLSFGGKWFGGWRSDTNHQDYVKAGYEHSLRQAEKIKNVEFLHSSYEKVEIPENSIIYCDPPYINTTSYDAVKNSGFSHNEFYKFIEEKVSEGHKVFISEYFMPEQFVPIWEKEVNMKLSVKSNSEKRVEKLFIHKSQL